MLFADEPLEHAALTRTVRHDGTIVFAVRGTLDRDAARVLGRLIRRDLLEARHVGRAARFVIDLRDAEDLEVLALESLKGTTQLVHGERGASIAFTHVSAMLREVLARTRYANVFPIHALDADTTSRLPAVPV